MWAARRKSSGGSNVRCSCSTESMWVPGTVVMGGPCGMTFRSAFYLCAGTLCILTGNFAILEKTAVGAFARLAHGPEESAAEPVPSFSDRSRATLHAPAFGRAHDPSAGFARGELVFVPLCAAVSGLYRRDAIRIPAPHTPPYRAADVRGRLGGKHHRNRHVRRL